MSLRHGQCDGISALCLCNAGRDAAGCTLTSTLASTHNLQLKIQMLRPALASVRYGIRDVAVRGCDRAKTPALAADAAALFTARLSLTPEVTSVVPERGSTAGGSDVTVTGRFFSTDQSKISVSLGPFGCAVTSITNLSAGQQRIV
ncbi:MAG: IPT/TIG domain-containing protein, partial [bacterium]